MIDDTASFCRYMSSCINLQINDYKLYSVCVKDCRYEISCLWHNDYCSVPMLLLRDRCGKLYLADMHWGISMGIAITYSTVVLAISMMIGTIVGLTVKRKLWIAVPAIQPAFYWCDAITYFPYRSLAYMGIALFAYLVFALIITRYKF